VSRSARGIFARVVAGGGLSIEPQVHLTVLQPNLDPLRVKLGPQTISLGRASECTIPIRDRFLSRRHAEILFTAQGWLVRDCGSVNGTLLNGRKLSEPSPLAPGDRIGLGDSEVVFDSPNEQSQLIQVESSSHATNLAIPLQKAVDDDLTSRGPERARILNQLALQFIEDRPMGDLFEFILDKVAELLHPSRAALALFGLDGKSFVNVKLRRQSAESSNDLVISRTLLDVVVGERKVVSYFETDSNDRFAKAQSIIAQQIRAAVCAPLLVGDQVLGVLYLDFLATRGAVSENDVRLIAQIARFAAVKLETTRLREQAMQQAKIEEELRTAYAIQSRLLPNELPEVAGYVFAGVNKPCKTVSGDYYDVIVRPDGRIYFVIADVSGKGITAALVMFALATAFNIFTRTDPSPAELASNLNQTLAPKTAPSKFATLVVGVLDPKSGTIEFANAGHVSPLLVQRAGVTAMASTDMVVGLFTHATYRNQSLQLEVGDSLVMFTDGISEAENEREDQLGVSPVSEMLVPLHGSAAPILLQAIEAHVHDFVCGTPMGDDVTILALTRVVSH
jgi:sigma-B regulation protein RsbU (phosphoserine phosphatase)